MESGDDQSFEPFWVGVVIVLGAVALGWLLSKAGGDEAAVAAFWPLLALSALFVFTLPFHKHLPPMPQLSLPNWLTRWGILVPLVTLNSCNAFSANGLGAMTFLSVVVIGLMIGVILNAVSKENE